MNKRKPDKLCGLAWEMAAGIFRVRGLVPLTGFQFSPGPGSEGLAPA